MKRYKEFSIFLILLSIVTLGCEDVIEVELADAEDVYVVDGWISNLEGEQVIQVSRSQQYFDNTQPPAITNAVVRVIRNNDTELIFEHTGQGFYELSEGGDLGTVEDEFELQIEVDGVILSTSTTMNRVPPIDSIGLEFRDDQPFSDDGIYANFFARDPIGEGDTYWIKTFVNGEYLDKATQLNIAYDAAFDEGGSDGLVFITPIRELMNQTDENDLAFPFVSGEAATFLDSLTWPQCL